MDYKHTVKRQKYYDAVIELHVGKQLSPTQISKVIPVDAHTVYRWIANFASERGLSYRTKVPTPFTMAKSTPSPISQSSLEEENERLRQEITLLKAELKHESLRADAFDEMINVAEGMFNIPIRKKAGAKQ